MELLSRVLLCCALSTLSASAEALSIPSRCECIRAQSRICSYKKVLKNFTVMSPSSYCASTQVIAEINHRTKEVCLDPTVKQAKPLIFCWNRFPNAPKKRMSCVRKRLCKVRKQRNRKGKKQSQGAGKEAQ
ncbi:uncharacterized protein O3C94_017887 isoform 2-T2 [Discoglossus pictus]